MSNEVSLAGDLADVPELIGAPSGDPAVLLFVRTDAAFFDEQWRPREAPHAMIPVLILDRHLVPYARELGAGARVVVRGRLECRAVPRTLGRQDLPHLVVTLRAGHGRLYDISNLARARESRQRAERESARIGAVA